MNCTVVTKIKFKKDDGVYIFYYLSDNSMPYLRPESEKKKDSKSQHLSELFLNEGRRAIDCWIITKMITNDVILKGKDSSLKKYHEALETVEYARLLTLYQRSTDKDNFFDTEDAQNLLNVIVDKRK